MRRTILGILLTMFVLSATACSDTGDAVNSAVGELPATKPLAGPHIVRLYTEEKVYDVDDEVRLEVRVGHMALDEQEKNKTFAVFFYCSDGIEIVENNILVIEDYTTDKFNMLHPDGNKFATGLEPEFFPITYELHFRVPEDVAQGTRGFIKAEIFEYCPDENGEMNYANLSWQARTCFARSGEKIAFSQYGFDSAVEMLN